MTRAPVETIEELQEINRKIVPVRRGIPQAGGCNL